MSKVPAYYTITPAQPPRPDVYHDHSDCPVGEAIPAATRRPGTAGRPRCANCVKLG